MTMTERYALEAAAIGMFESFMRQQASEGRGKSVQDWNGIDQEDRAYWRAAAAKIVMEYE